MRQWEHKIEKDVRGLPPETVAAELAASLKELPQSFRKLQIGCLDLDEIIFHLEDEAENPGSSTEDNVNDILRDLYDWADEHKLWVYLTT